VKSFRGGTTTIGHLEVSSRTASYASDNRPPLLFVHGVFHGAWCWEEHFLDFFAEHGWDAYALTLRGHRPGDDPRTLRRSWIKHYLEDVGTVADALSGSPVLVGHSMGGFIVQRYIGQRYTPAAVLLAPMPPSGGLRTPLLRRSALLAATSIARGRLKAIVDTPSRSRAAFFSRHTPDYLVKRYTAMLGDESLAAAADMLMGRRPRVPPVGRIPVLVMGASDDGIFSEQQLRTTAARYATEPIIVAETGHDMMLEPTWRLTAAQIESWLKTVLRERV
jgi:pimeloyl-ACP methyl ester carboxylesterase